MNGEVWVLDASAFVKLIRPEAETAVLRGWVRRRLFASSALLLTEARRAFAHDDAVTRHRCERLLAETHLVDLTASVLDSAGRMPGRHLRSLDAIYLACALEIGDDLAGLVSYDARQLAAATALDMRTASPGANSRGD
ncbi:type II toxin-antitoxin system VapC family toxin [Candidatus Poriferisodalis sp.]|uniref:type II toxin-antitoxin system VapC family toxin n=1 Tax=Candidatus Poriferisodalis sp. TaxID=3101277 RepID=UPI003B028C6D